MKDNQTVNITKKFIKKRHQSAGFKSLSSLIFSLGLTLGVSNHAAAHCNWSHPNHCAIDAAEEAVNTGEDVGNTVVKTTNLVSNTFIKTGDLILSTLGDAVLDVYRELAGLMFQQMYDPMVNMADAWKTLVATEPAKFDRLERAIQNRDSSELKPAIEDVLVSLYTYAGFANIVKDFKDENAGSLLLIVSAGGGTGVTVEGDIGIALDIDYLTHLGKRVANGHTSSKFSGAMGSIFTAAGLQVGPAAGGGVDFVVGYHLANPGDVYGPGMDFSLEVKAKVGGSVGIGFDMSRAPWQIVTGVIGIGAGVEVKAAVGPSYAAVLGQLCSDGIVKKNANACS